jgi:hypothetical protein
VSSIHERGWCDDLEVRLTPLVGKKPWFGPRRLGWGLSPVSYQGWALTAGVAGALVWLRRGERDPRTTAPLATAITAAFVLVVFLKGTDPGGRRARIAFEAARKNSS